MPVVTLFNTVRKQQEAQQDTTEPDPSVVSKTTFLDMLKSGTSSSKTGEAAAKKGWLKDDYMLGSSVRKFERGSGDEAESEREVDDISEDEEEEEVEYE
eukprot:m.104473 g.104473  ORF g.104473 m.104473 type:complete len:99 (+) comp9104_c0_seq3:96-392(+)